jgi:Trypsin-co-occurring domain 2
MSDIGLGEAIKALRQELTKAKGQGEGERMRFEPGPVNLELQVVVTKDVHGQIGWKVLEIGGDVQSAKTQKISLTLTPQWWDPTSKQYTTDFLVAGTLRPSEAALQSTIDQFDGVPETDADPEDED